MPTRISMWDNRGMEENTTKIPPKDRPHYINYGIGVLMVALAAIIGHFNGGFWWWVIGSAIIGFALVLHGHFPTVFSLKRH